MKNLCKVAFSVWFILFILAGCVEKQILDDVNLIDGIGFDDAEKGLILGTILFPVFLPDQKPENKTYSAKSEIKKTLLQEIERQASDPVVTGSIELVLFGKKLATEEGILELVDAFQRDPGVGSGIHLAIVDGKAKEFLEGEYGIRGNATHISNLIEKNYQKEDLPKTNLQLFLSDFYEDGQTPYLPQLKQLSKESIELNGVCFFKYGKILHTISPERMFFFKLLVDKYSEGLHRVRVNEGEAAIQSIKSSHNFDLKKKNPVEIEINLNVNGVINEFTGNDLTPKEIKNLEKTFEKEISEECIKLIQEFQEKKIDPIGFGKYVRTQTRGFDLKKWWDSQYPALSVKVKTDVTIIEAGVIE